MSSPPGEGDEESILSLSTLLFAFVTLAVYILFLRPTQPPTRNNNNHNNNNNNNNNGTATTSTTTSRTTAVQQRRANALAGANANAARRQQQNTTVAIQRPPVLSENAIEVLKDCRAYPPHVEPTSVNNKNNSIGCYNLLSDSGLVSFNYIKAAASATASAANSNNNNSNNNTGNATKNSVPIDLATTATAINNNNINKLQRQERAKILSRLFANSTTTATPPMKGSTFVIGLSNEQLKNKEQKMSIIRVIKGLATYYNVLVIVAVDNIDNSNNHRYESTQKTHEQVVQTLRGGGGGGGGGEESREEEGNANSSLLLMSESILPSHRILLSKSSVGRIALVRQLSSNIGLTIDFDAEVKIQLEKFGYNVSIIKNWYETFPHSV